MSDFGEKFIVGKGIHFSTNYQKVAVNSGVLTEVYATLANANIEVASASVFSEGLIIYVGEGVVQAGPSTVVGAGLVLDIFGTGAAISETSSTTGTGFGGLQGFGAPYAWDSDANAEGVVLFDVPEAGRAIAGDFVSVGVGNVIYDTIGQGDAIPGSFAVSTSANLLFTGNSSAYSYDSTTYGEGFVDTLGTSAVVAQNVETSGFGFVLETVSYVETAMGFTSSLT